MEESAVPKKDIGLGVVSIGFGTWIILYTAAEIKKKSQFWPTVIGWGIVILGALILAMGIFNLIKEKKASAGKTAAKKTDAKEDMRKYLKVAAVMGLLVVFYFVFQYVSYVLATVILIVGTSVLLGYRNWKILIPVAVVMAVALYLVFWKVFNVHFPAPFY